MKLMVGVAVVAGAVGVWAGFHAWESAAVARTVEASLAILFSGNLLFCSWLWWRAQPGSGDAMALPTLIVLQTAMLIGILPRLLWPAAETFQMAASVASAVIMIGIAVVQIRKRRRRRQRTGAA